MARDPAFLFYASDFLTGVQDLTMEERGQYITLLCIQHQKGRLTNKLIKLTVGTVNEDVLSKFSKDDKGNYYNERLEAEIQKRKEHSAKQSERAKDGWKKRKGEPEKVATVITYEVGPSIHEPFKKSDSFFRINGHTYHEPVSVYMQTNFASFIEQWKMKQGNDISEAVFEELNTKYHSTDFLNQNHIKNAFTSTWQRLTKQNNGKSKIGSALDLVKRSDEILKTKYKDNESTVN